MAAAKPNVSRYRYLAGEHRGMIITINRQMRGVKIETHPTDKTLAGQVYDLPIFLRDFDLEHMELV